MPGGGAVLGAGPVVRRGAKALDMSQEARMARARGMGFDVDRPVYHGTDRTIDAFDPAQIGSSQDNRLFGGRGFYFSTDKRSAGMYGDNVIEARGRLGNTLDLTNEKPLAELLPDAVEPRTGKTLGALLDDYNKSATNLRIEDVSVKEVRPGFFEVQWKVGGEWKMKQPNPLVSRVELSDDPSGYAFARQQELPPDPRQITTSHIDPAELTRAAQSAGFGSIRAPASIGTAGDEIVIFDPRNIRSTQAAFDPARADSADLLASRAAPGGLLAAPERERLTYRDIEGLL